MRRLALVLIVAALGCRQDMHDQLKVEPFEASTFFADGRSARPPIEGTVARGRLELDDHLYRGIGPDGKFVTTFPFSVDRAVVERGRSRYGIFCEPCHGERGDGRGMIVRRGFPQPSSFHVQRLRAIEHGYVYDVISNGFGKMSSYAAQLEPNDRWAVVAYVRALQLSQATPLVRLDADERAAIAASEGGAE